MHKECLSQSDEKEAQKLANMLDSGCSRALLLSVYKETSKLEQQDIYSCERILPRVAELEKPGIGLDMTAGEIVMNKTSLAGGGTEITKLWKQSYYGTNPRIAHWNDGTTRITSADGSGIIFNGLHNYEWGLEHGIKESWQEWMLPDVLKQHLKQGPVHSGGAIDWLTPYGSSTNLFEK